MNVTEVRARIRKLERRLEQMLIEGAACCGVTLVQCHTLVELAQLAPVNLTELADRLELDKSTVSRTVDGLVAAGLVRREPDPDNRRAVLLSLTDDGIKRVGRIHELSDAVYGRILADMSEAEVETMLAGMELLTEGLKRAADGTACELETGGGCEQP